jgi:hypothetical protein
MPHWLTPEPQEGEIHMRPILPAVSLALVMVASVAQAQTQPASNGATAPASTPQAGKYTTNTTTLGTLVADPAAKAVLTKHLPQLLNSDGPGGGVQEQASAMTLKEIQEATRAYSGDSLSDKILAEIDQDLAKLPAKN